MLYSVSSPGRDGAHPSVTLRGVLKEPQSEEFRVMTNPEREYDPPSKRGDLAFGAFYAGAIGGTVVAFMFLTLDLLADQELFTASLLGAVLFYDAPADTYSEINLNAVALFSMVHIAGFGALGAVGSTVYQTLFAAGRKAMIPTGIVLFLASEGLFLLASATVMPGVAARIGHGLVLLANALAAIAMAAFLHWAYRQNPEWEEQSALTARE